MTEAEQDARWRDWRARGAALDRVADRAARVGFGALVALVAVIAVLIL